ncbi:MAG: hypothetical protein AAFY57_16155 [Cyanobacteria bacterium J06642_2]
MACQSFNRVGVALDECLDPLEFWLIDRLVMLQRLLPLPNLSLLSRDRLHIVMTGLEI